MSTPRGIGFVSATAAERSLSRPVMDAKIPKKCWGILKNWEVRSLVVECKSREKLKNVSSE